jgi:superfamily II DNA or RNA helicase
MQIDVGVLKSRIKTDNPKLLKALVDLYAFNTPGASYMPSSRYGKWDGKTRFVSSTGIFRTGMLEKVLEDLKRIECSPTLNYTYERKLITPESWNLQGFKLRDYQDEAIRVAVSSHRRIIQSPTGSGKTLMMAGIVKALQGRKMVILFDAKQLLTQTYEFLSTTCKLDNIGLCYGEGYIYGDVMLCTVQSIEKILDTHLEETEILMVDEVHKFGNGKHRLAAIQSFPNAQYRLGFTATVPSEDIPIHSLEGALGSVYKVRTTSDLIDEGHLTKPTIQMLSVKEPDKSYDDYSYRDVYTELIVDNEERNAGIARIVNTIRNSHDKARILILVNRLDHGRNLERLLGDSCFYLRGDNSIGDRYNTIRSFVSCRGNSILLGTKILETGVDIREITHFINARGLKSPIATIQALGRSLRLHDTKEKVFIYDFMDRGKYLNTHARRRYNTYKKEGHEVEIL